MRNFFALTKAEQRCILVVLLVLVAIAVARHYRDTTASPPAGSTSLPSAAPSASATPEEPLDVDDAP